ncbi:hypothetical protein [Luteipulveratus mongoliensis]|uniref:hypothetical protein n=1 Tax=Luteipulveratus mongoliensis TaxID=571913 RepID=UPI0012ECD92B|nr:hypothetical protein [Luteipulveratus mongoliensis]
MTESSSGAQGALLPPRRQTEGGGSSGKGAILFGSATVALVAAGLALRELRR